MAINDIMQQLAEELPSDDIKTLKKGGATISYIPHYRVKERLNEVCPDWSGEVKDVLSIGGKIAVIYRLTIGGISREAIGYEDDSDGLYGDPFSNAEAMAFKRAAAWFGLGLYLYGEKRRNSAQRKPAPTNGKSKANTNANWMHDADTVTKLMNAAREQFDLAPSDVMLALLVEDVREFRGTKKEAWQMISDYAARKNDLPK